MAEEKRVGQSEQEEQNGMGTRGSRDAEGGRPQRVKRGKGEASTEGQEGMGEQGAREADAATGGACMPPGSPTCAKRAADGGSRRVIDRTCMSEQAGARMARVKP